MKAILIALIIFMPFMCCNSNKAKNYGIEDKNPDYQKEETISETSKETDKRPEEKYLEIVQEDFAIRPLEGESYLYKDLNKNFINPFVVEKKPVINKFDDTIVDTTITFRRGSSFFTFYKTHNKIFMEEFDITEPNFAKFKMKIDIGIPRTDLLEKFNLNSNLYIDSLSVIDEDANSYVGLKFKNNKLYRIQSSNIM
jgi:hypothetical protein